MLLYTDGRLRDPDEPILSAFDHGVLVGDGVFETCELIDGRTFALSRHLDRLEASCRTMAMPPPDRSEVRAGVAEIERAWRQRQTGALGRVRITWTSGSGPLGSDRGPGPGALLLAAAPAAEPVPVPVQISGWVRNERSPLTGVKSTSYGENVLALAQGKHHGAQEAIFANTQGQLCEGTGTNIFIDTGSELLTPPLSSGALAGITRALVLEWAEDAGIKVRIEPLGIDVLRTTSHAALTSSTRGVVPISAVDGRDLAPGSLTLQMSEFFRRRRLDDMDP